MDKLTLRELCETCGVSRRAVQGYEKTGMVKASGKTSRGYLLYDHRAQLLVKRIKLYQDFGFTVNEIAALSACSQEQVLAALKGKKEELVQKAEQATMLIREIDHIIKSIE